MERIADFVHRLLSEDIGRGDLFARCKAPKRAAAIVKTKNDGIFAGEYYAQAIAKEMNLDLEMRVKDGDVIKDGDILLDLRGSDITLLQTERSLLNLLQHASGIATNTRRYAYRLEGSGLILLDTRKTRAHLRRLEKYATRVGGAVNHRFGLDDCLMIKDTHLATIDSLPQFVAHARKQIPWTATIEIECETIETAKAAFEAGADIVMCDNMSIDQIKEVVKLKNAISPATKIEASGNITLENIACYKDTGIDAISTGSLIHHAVWLDFSMKIVANG
ncbi:putative nicotinate-nucleotide pyrophosphorylase [carboxylating] [Campylobacterota bacterium]|nr:putative nicotinate-nucleotide pyrophosphorylase [carboxylating] [Campylobacterota bacterium]